VLVILFFFVYVFFRLYFMMKQKHGYEFDQHKNHMKMYFASSLVYIVIAVILVLKSGGYLQYIYLSGGP
jgi:Na+/H+ antiporter NhaC